MSENTPDRLRTRFNRRTVMGALAAGGGIAALGTSVAQEDEDEEEQEEWVPAEASEVHAAALTGTQAGVEAQGGGCVSITPQEEDTLAVEVVVEGVECITQAHIHEGERGEDGPVVAPLFEFTEELDGTGSGDPISTTPETPLIEGTTVEDPELVENILTDPEAYYVNVHTVHNPGGEVRGQILGFDRGQETELEPQPAEFLVSDLDPAEATVTQGDVIDVSATVENAGDITATQTVELRVDGIVVGEESVELACRESTTVTFEDVDTADLEPDEYEHGVFTDDDSETGSLTVEVDPEPAEFLVSALDPEEATVTQGDVIDVSATIENAGEEEGTQTVEFRVDDELDPEAFVTVETDEEEDEDPDEEEGAEDEEEADDEDEEEADDEDEEEEFLVVLEQELTLEPDQEETVVFEGVDTGALEPAGYEHGVFSEDDSETGTLTVEPPEAEFAVSELDPMDVSVEQGDIIDVSATITNEGDADGTQTIEFRVDGDPLAEQELTLDPGGEETVEFDGIDTADLEPDEYEHGVFSEDDFQTATLTVVNGPDTAEFIVSDLEPEDVTVTQGDVIDVSATVTNEGDADGTQTIEFRVDGDPLVDQELTLETGDEETVEFDGIDTADLEPDEYDHGVFSEDDSQTAVLTVDPEDDPDDDTDDDTDDDADDDADDDTNDDE